MFPQDVCRAADLAAGRFPGSGNNPGAARFLYRRRQPLSTRRLEMAVQTEKQREYDRTLLRFVLGTLASLLALGIPPLILLI